LQFHVSPRDTQAATQAALTAMIRYRELDVVGGPITQLPQDLHFEESHDRVGQISNVGWPEAQAGLLVKHFHDWQRVRPRPRGRDSGRPTGLVVGRYLVRLRKGMGRGQATQGEGLVLLPAWLRHCGTASAGIEQVLTKKTGQEERAVEGMAKRRGDGSFYTLQKRPIPAKTR
jgi:hypothetical protein